MIEFSGKILSSAAVLILVMDPLGNIPMFLSFLKGIDKRRRRVIIIRELLIALAVLLIFLFFGEQLLLFLHLQQETVSISGGIVLFIIGIRMIFPTSNGVMGQQLDGEPFIVPLAIPLIAGPSALATIVLMVHTAPEKTMQWFVSLLIAWSTTAIILMMAPMFYKLLKKRGLAAIERLMGMLLIMISVQMLLNGIKGFFGNW